MNPTPPKRKLCDSDPPQIFAALAKSSENVPPFPFDGVSRSNSFSFASPSIPSSAKHSVAVGNITPASRPKWRGPGRMTPSRRDEEVKTTPHANTAPKCTQHSGSGDRYDTQINGIKSRQFVAESFDGGLNGRLLDQQKDISRLEKVTREQGDMIKHQALLVEEQKLVIQQFEGLCINNTGKRGESMEGSYGKIDTLVWNHLYSLTEMLLFIVQVLMLSKQFQSLRSLR